MSKSQGVQSGASARGAQRPGGRTERVRKAVATVVLEFLQTGMIDFSVQDVAQKAGVARSTLYARWPTREALITEALTVHSLDFKIVTGRNWQETLRNFAFSFRDFSLQPAEIAINSLVAYSRGGFITQETQRIWSGITSSLSVHLEDAQKNGEIRSDVSPQTIVVSLMTCISGLVVLAKSPPSDAFIEELLEIHLKGCLNPKAPVSASAVMPGKGATAKTKRSG
ncbi:MAG TPA: TetR/AcrR family transcriptional regulator [Pedomonas sp.]|uniref:TetR/AcrR family transcriptional regulator n=1 Tax=Pedomonas sp. TaxID=2976421 RepID=UPI002F3E3DCE